MPAVARSSPQLTSSSPCARKSRLSVVTATIAHEVNQPLSGIMTNASACLRMLSADPPNLEGARDTMLRTLRDVNRAAAVVARMRALFAHHDAVTHAVDLVQVVRDTLAGCQAELAANRVTVVLELGEDLPTVPGDGVQLQQVITNLVRNASDAMVGVHGRPRTITIRVQRQAGDAVRISVKDRGIGIDVRKLEKLFVPFYTTKPQGMGIGLSICQSIVEQHRGELWATANDDGAGATFSMAIPCMVAEPRPKRERITRLLETSTPLALTA